MTTKPDTVGVDAPVPAIEAVGIAPSGLFTFGASDGTRKRLFNFAKPGVAKRSRKTALGPTRSQFGCD